MAMDMSLMAAELSLGRSNSCEMAAAMAAEQSTIATTKKKKKAQSGATEEKRLMNGDGMEGLMGIELMNHNHNRNQNQPIHQNSNYTHQFNSTHRHLHVSARHLPPDLHALEEYHKALEEERLKIRVFERELPFCMRLLDDAIEASREKLDDRLKCKLLTTAAEEDEEEDEEGEADRDGTAALARFRGQDPLTVISMSSAPQAKISVGAGTEPAEPNCSSTPPRKRKLLLHHYHMTEPGHDVDESPGSDARGGAFGAVDLYHDVAANAASDHDHHYVKSPVNGAKHDHNHMIKGPISVANHEPAGASASASHNSSYKWPLTPSPHDTVRDRRTSYATDHLLIQKGASTAGHGQGGRMSHNTTSTTTAVMGDVSGATAATDITLPSIRTDEGDRNGVNLFNHMSRSAGVASAHAQLAAETISANDRLQAHHKDYSYNSLIATSPDLMTAMPDHHPAADAEESAAADPLLKKQIRINPLINNRFRPPASSSISMVNSEYSSSINANCSSNCCKPIHNIQQDGSINANCKNMHQQRAMKPPERLVHGNHSGRISSDEAAVAAVDYLSATTTEINLRALTEGHLVNTRSTPAGACQAAAVASSSCSATLSNSSGMGMMQAVQRKPRRCWSPELHQRFLNALNHLGGCQVATPKQIRELMNVEGLTNDEVKSHLQKFRLHMRRPHNMSLGSIQTDNPIVEKGNTNGHHLVVFGHIWVPPEQYQQPTNVHTLSHHSHPINDTTRASPLLEHRCELDSSYNVVRQGNEIMNKSQLQMGTSNDVDGNAIKACIDNNKVTNVKLQLQFSDMCNNMDCQELEEKALKSEGDRFVNMDSDGHGEDYKYDGEHKTRSNTDEEIKLRITCSNYGIRDQLINNAIDRV